MLRVMLVCLALPVLSVPALAAFPCDELWGERNAVYKDAGYCFKTSRGIQAFGNAGCKYDNLEEVPLSARDRAKIAELVRDERAHNCPR